MPRISWYFDGDAFADGSGGDKFLIDITEKLSELYGKLVRQSSVVRVRQINARIVNPGTLVQDQAIAVSGKMVYYHPTRNRKLAWKNAFETWLSNRQALGVRSRGADFRVGLLDDYSTDVGVSNDGVRYNAWINDEEEPLMLVSTTENQDIFGNWTENNEITSPDGSNANFGHWAQKDSATLGDDLDFVTNQTAYYAVNEASKTAAVVSFMVNFSAWFDDAQADPSDFASATNAQTIRGPFDVMCGLVGVYVDTTTVDDSETQTQDWGLEITLDIESWSPLMPKRKKRKALPKKGKGAKK